eukprot:TRINITY_DN15993_c0_g1_i1.p1 TRINITY_DN15993_c0_g1~~TRINITY_DN15993_c0_g1_i1.p1  ORF type:complete len:144 (+),score=34.25 TRINITY_DN15993_c0_g1_i1:115-546(+)
MATVEDPQIAEVYAAIQSDADPTAYVVLGYAAPLVLQVVASGEGGIAEATANFTEDQCLFAYIRVTTGDEESKRAKFILISWIGENAKILQKAKMSIHKSDVKSVFRNITCEFQASDSDDIDAQKLMAAVVKAGGANYMGQSS